MNKISTKLFPRRSARFVAASLLALACAAVVPSAKAIVIVQDTFTGADNTNLEGLAPDTVNQPGGLYGGLYAWTAWPERIEGNRADIGPNTGVAVSIADNGPYTKPQILQISGDMSFGPIVTVSPPFDDWNGTEPFGVRGNAMGLGFYTVVPFTDGTAQRPPTGYSGLRLGHDGGLDLYINGVDQVQLAAYVGFFDTNAVHTLSYTVNLTTGGISDVLVDGQSKSFSTTGFTSALTDFAGMDVAGNFITSHAFWDNFIVSGGDLPVPEPTVVTLLGLAGLLLRQWRRYFTPKR